MTTLDYESIEIYLGDHLRRQDCLDIHSDHFFPVTLLDELFHYSELSRGRVLDEHQRPVHRNFHGHDFDRWIDNLVARTELLLAPEEGSNEVERIRLVDIDSMTLGESSHVVTVTLPDETSYTLLSPDGKTLLRVGELKELSIRVDISRLFSMPPVDSDASQYMGFGMLAHIIRVVCERSGIDPKTVNPTELSRKVFAHFKDELTGLIPSLWNDMEHIAHYTTPRLVSNENSGF